MLKGKQKNIDVNKDGKITGEDFSMLKKSKKVRMQKKDAMGVSPEGMVEGGMSITRGQNEKVQSTLVKFKGVF